MHTDGDIPLFLILLCVLCIGVVLLLAFRSVQNLIPQKNRVILWTLRGVALVLLFLLALNPFAVEREADPDAFHVAVLGDLSGSMHLADTQGERPRVDHVRDAFSEENPGSLFLRLNERYDASKYSFSDDLHRELSSELELSPGLTGIGSALSTLLDNQASEPKALGAVVLMTDGISLQGESVFEVAKEYRDLGIPITVVGVGEDASEGDVRLEFSDPPEEVPLSEPFELKVLVENEFKNEVEFEVGLFEKETLIEKQSVTLRGREKKELTFSVQADIPGNYVYRARILESVEGDINPTTDIAFAPIEVTEPEVMKVLYLSAKMAHHYRFLKMTLREDAQLALRSIIRLGEERVLRSGFEEEQTPLDETVLVEDPKMFMDHSVLIVETSVLQYLSEEATEGLKTFLTNRGGGALFLGAPEELSEEMLSLLPVRKSLPMVPQSRQFIQIESDPIFKEAEGGTLFSAPGLFLAKNTLTLGASTMARGGRPILQTKAGGVPIMAMQAYGAGRVVFLGMSNTWRWRMDSNRGMEQHNLFWRHLLTWLGAGGKPRLEMPVQGNVQSLESPVKLDLTVRGQDFRLSEDAKVSATVTTPEGERLPPQVLVPEMLEPGVYGGVAMLEKPGEYKVDYDIQFPEGEALHQQAFFVGEFTGAENTDLRFRERDLKDIARITDGAYFSYRDVDDIDVLNVSMSLPMLEEKFYWTRNWLFLALILGVVGMEWFLRRRIGLR